MSEGKFGEPWSSGAGVVNDKNGDCRIYGDVNDINSIERAITCVNACAGIEEPGKKIPLALEVLGVLYFQETEKERRDDDGAKRAGVL